MIGLPKRRHARHRTSCLTIILVVLLILFLFPGAASGAGKDFNGDGNDEIASFYDYPQNCAAIWLAESAAPVFSQTPLWASSYAGWDATKSRVYAGNFDDNPAFDDLAILQSYPNACAALWVFSSTGTTLDPTPVWASVPWGFDVSKTKTASGDFDGDGRDEILALTEFPNSNAVLILFDNPGTGWEVKPVWTSPEGTFAVTLPQVSAGDFDNDGKDELAVLKAYPQSCAAVWVFDEGASMYTATPWWASSYGAWDVVKSRMVAGDFNNDNLDELAVLYDYPRDCAALWMFASNGSSFAASPKWASIHGGWDASRSDLTTGDTDGNGSDSLYVMQGYPNNCAALWQYEYDGAFFSGTPVWASALGAWNAKKSRFASGNTFVPTKSYNDDDYVIGYSVLGRPIVASKFGTGNRRYLFIGAHHGDEQQGEWALERFREFLSANPSAIPAGVEVWIVPCLNPDGVVAGTRWNARGVNLNRNYGTNDWGTFDVTALSTMESAGLIPMTDMSVVITGIPFTFNYPGPGPFSEPETVAVRDLCTSTSFRAMIAVHDAESCVYWGQTGADLAYLFGGAAGLPVKGPLSSSGDATRWIGQAYATPAITVEMTPGQAVGDPATVFGAYLPAFLATLNY
jgi:hypothetical protein